MQILNQGETTASLRRVFFILLDATTGAVKQTGKAGTLTGFVTKADGVTTGKAGSFVELSAANCPGLYYYQATTGELDVLGPIVFTFTCAACLDRTVEARVGKTNVELSAEVDANEVKIDAVPTVGEIDTQLSGVHGAGDWGTGSTGTNPVTITVKDSVTLLPISGVIVHARNSGGTIVYDWGVTDENGQVAFLLDNGTYYVWCSKVSSYSFTNPTTLTVSGVATLTIQGTPFSPTTPPSSETCNLYGWERDVQGNAKVVTIKAEVLGDKNFLSSNPHIIREAETVTSAVADGLWELVLTRSAAFTDATVKYRITVAGVMMGTFVIPNQATKSFADLYVGV